MARMIPPEGPVENDSFAAEPNIYWRLKRLPDDFTIIHSLPWLSRAAEEIDGRPVPTGEIDFLILHSSLGILAIEVKGGSLKYERTKFTYVNSSQSLYPVRQVRRSSHALAKWVAGAGGAKFRIGYALVFPDSDMKGKPIPPSLIDYSKGRPESICVDRTDLDHLEDRIVQIMQFWKDGLETWILTDSEIKQIVDLICPVADYSPSWLSRIIYDNCTWLELTPEQLQILRQFDSSARWVVQGRGGTGKTILAITWARQLSMQNKKTLFLTYNGRLTEHIQKQLLDTSVIVMTFHELCRRASKRLGRPIAKSREWYKQDGPSALADVIESTERPNPYDAIVIDEAQVFAANWLQSLAKWFADKPFVAFCDETQAFRFEELTFANQIADIIGARVPFLLTVNLRSPRAVFERLRESHPTTYQQFSPRALDPEELVEIVSQEPAKDFYNLLARLHSQSIPRESIVVVFTVEPPPNLDKVQTFVGQVERIHTFRGLEAPVVVVWTIGDTSEDLLACAYTRATSRCFVIFEPYVFLPERINPFIEALANSPSSPPNLAEAVKTAQAAEYARIGPPLLDQYPLVSIYQNEELKLAWSPHLGSWFIEKDKHPETMSLDLWIAELTLNTPYPVFVLGESVHGLHYGRIYEPIKSLLAPVDYVQACLVWVNEQQRWAKAILDSKEHEYIVSPTEGEWDMNGEWVYYEAQSVVLSREEISQVQRACVRVYEKNPDIAEDSLPLYALREWLQILYAKRLYFSQRLRSSRTINYRGYDICESLIGVSVLRADPFSTMLLKDLRGDYPAQRPDLLTHIPRHTWDTWVSNRISGWLNRKYLASHKDGSYRRLPDPKTLGESSESSDSSDRI